jgi:acyl-CoA thioesterase I
MLIKIIFALSFLIQCNKVEESKTVSVEKDLKKIIFFGDSLTAGLGLAHPDESFPQLIHQKLKAEGFDLKLIHAGVSGDTTSGGLGRLDWVLGRGVDYFILELGANDGMRGVKTELIKENLISIIRTVKKKNPKAKILLVRMLAFPNFGPLYVGKFNKIFPEVAKEESVALSPFLLEKVAGIKNLNQKDGIHPTKEGHLLILETLYPSVKTLLYKN